MSALKTLLVVFIWISFAQEVNAQTLESVNEIAKTHQNCLDTGVNMLGCSRQYYLQVDELLNVVYNKLRTTMSAAEKEQLKKEQISWLKKRDNYFKKQNQIFQENFERGEWGSDMAMITYSEQADFVKERVIVLISLLNKREKSYSN